MPADQRDRRAHLHADASGTRLPVLSPHPARRRRPARQRAACAALALACAGWLCGAPPTHAAAASGHPADEAAADLRALYAHTLGQPGAEGTLLDRWQEGLAAAEHRLGGPGLRLTPGELPVDQLAGWVLRLRTLEEIGLRAEQLEAAALLAEAAERLRDRLAAYLDPPTADAATGLALAAGWFPGRATWAGLQPRLYAFWRASWFGPAPPDPTLHLWLLHALAPWDVRVLEDVAGRPPRDATEAQLGQLVAALRAGRVALFRAEDPARDLLVAVRLGIRAATVARRAQRTAEQLGELDVLAPSEATWRALRAGLDSLRLAVGLEAGAGEPGRDGARPERTHRGAARWIQRAAAPSWDAADLLARSWKRLRWRTDTRELQRRGLQANLTWVPDEIAEGQSVLATWSLTTARPWAVHAWRARIDADPVGIADAPDSLLPATPYVVRTRGRVLGTERGRGVHALEGTLAFAVEGLGDVELCDRNLVRVVAPVQAQLEPFGGPMFVERHKRLTLHVTSRSAQPITGRVTVLPTADWEITPARGFRFQLRRPGQSVHQALDVTLPPDASPGPYEMALRFEVEGRPAGTLRLRLVQPLQWVVIGPFDRPQAGQLLPPERGVNLDRRARGAGGMAVAWMLAPPSAHDPDGALDLDALFEHEGGCACALTVIDSPEPATPRLIVDGATRVVWNGETVPPDGTVALHAGRNTLLVRSCDPGEVWRLNARLLDADGAPLRVVDNELSRLLDGFAALERAPLRAGEPAQRLVQVEVRAPEAREVAVLGAFNAWVPETLERQPDGRWRRDFLLAPGRYAYKLLVDGRLQPDPAAGRWESDGFGGRNSILVVP